MVVLTLLNCVYFCYTHIETHTNRHTHILIWEYRTQKIQHKLTLNVINICHHFTDTQYLCYIRGNQKRKRASMTEPKCSRFLFQARINCSGFQSVMNSTSLSSNFEPFLKQLLCFSFSCCLNCSVDILPG